MLHRALGLGPPHAGVSSCAKGVPKISAREAQSEHVAGTELGTGADLHPLHPPIHGTPEKLAAGAKNSAHRTQWPPRAFVGVPAWVKASSCSASCGARSAEPQRAFDRRMTITPE